MTRVRCGHEIVTIHDSIGSHPNHCAETVCQYGCSMKELAVMDYWTKVFNQLGTSVEVPYAKGKDAATPIEISAIPESKHILC